MDHGLLLGLVSKRST
uniref:Uncharacterized protein n=1 Tax=Cucumis sativus TaxID=3659 RepID=A0A0A0LH27_CUCSA